MSEPSRHVNNLLVKYKHLYDMGGAGVDDISLQFKQTVFSALFCPDSHVQRFKVIHKPLVQRLSTLNRLEWLTLYIQNCYPTEHCGFLRPVKRFVFFSHVFEIGSKECFLLVCDLLRGERLYTRECSWVLHSLTARLPVPLGDELQIAVTLAIENVLKNNNMPSIQHAVARLRSRISYKPPSPEVTLVAVKPSDTVCSICGWDHPDVPLDLDRL